MIIFAIIFNKVLSQDEIDAYKTCLIMEKRFISSFGTSKKVEGITVDDLSGNGNDGIINGATYEYRCSRTVLSTNNSKWL